MALSGVPVIRTLSDCADYATTVQPYLPSLAALPSTFIDALARSPAELRTFYTETNPYLLGLGFSILLGGIVLVSSEIRKEYSQIDRLWSILPALYILHFNIWARLSSIAHARLDLALFWAILWSIRLSYNFWRRGGYASGGEDYRWAIIKKNIGPIGMTILNITFISFAQSILLFLVTTPAYILMLASRVHPNVTLPDIIFNGLLLTLLAAETIADQQQWNFQQAKKIYLKTAKIPTGCELTQEDLDRGFIVSGLWAWSRHPNLACEMSMWITFYHWAGFAANNLLNYTAIGTIGYLLIFFGSTPLTEWISSGKYPQYKEYQQLVGCFFPSMLGGVWKSKKA